MIIVQFNVDLVHFIQEFFLKRFDLQRSRSKSHVTKAEVKIFVIMCYYVVMGIFTLSIYGYYLAADTGTFSEFQEYSACQSVGIQPDRDCGDAPDFRSQEIDVLAFVSSVLQILLPLIILIFIANYTSNCCCKMQLLKTLAEKSKKITTSSDIV